MCIRKKRPPHGRPFQRRLLGCIRSRARLIVLADAVEGEAGDQILQRQLLGQQLLVGGAPNLPGGTLLLQFGEDLVPLPQQVRVQAVIGRQNAPRPSWPGLLTH